MSDSEDNCNLTAKECQERIDKFIEVSGTDEAFAQAHLQEHSWDVEKALNSFLGLTAPAEVRVESEA